jgi:integrase
VLQAKPGAARIEIADAVLPGLYLVVQPSGAKSWATRYRVGRRSRKLTIGSYPKVGLAAARDAARKALESVSIGTDPAAVKKARRNGEAAENSVAASIERYKAEHVNVNLRPNTRRYTIRELDRAAATWKDRALPSITRQEIDVLITAGASPSVRNQRWKVLRPFFKWATIKGVLENDPASILPKPSKERQRKRFLTDDELATVWHACETTGAPGRLARLIMLTAMRRQEAAELKPNEVHRDAIRIGQDRIKTDEPLTIYLTPMMRKVLDACPAGGKYVLSGGEHPVPTGDKTLQAIESKTPDVAHWTFHDLRRSVRTGCARIGIPWHIAELMLNHDISNMGYDQHEYTNELRDAWKLWSEHIAKIVGEQLAAVA